MARRLKDSNEVSGARSAHHWMVFNLNDGLAQGGPYTKPIGTLEGFAPVCCLALAARIGFECMLIFCVSRLQLYQKGSYGGRVSPPQTTLFGPRSGRREEKRSEVRTANLVVSSLNMPRRAVVIVFSERGLVQW